MPLNWSTVVQLTVFHQLCHPATVYHLYEHVRVDRMASVGVRKLDRDVVADMDLVVVGKVNWDNRLAFVASQILDHLLGPTMHLVSLNVLYCLVYLVYRAEIEQFSISLRCTTAMLFSTYIFCFQTWR